MTLKSFVDLLRCPASGQQLVFDRDELVTLDGHHRYPVLAPEIPAFAEKPDTEEARQQLAHYDRIATAYHANLHYPHTIEYMTYLDTCLRRVAGEGSFGVAAELCCGHGEAISLFGARMTRGIGLDVSTQMLRLARSDRASDHLCFVQGDATILPLAPASFDTVFMLGGIHHVPDRQRLFAQVAQILKPGGRFIFREPVSDFWLWRFLRSIVYRLSPTLDHENERPLRLSETLPPLAAAPTGGYEIEVSPGFMAYQDEFRRLIASSTVLAPGLGALAGLDAWPNAATQPARGDDAYRMLFTAYEQALWAPAGPMAPAVPALQQTLVRLIRGGGRVAVGSDAPLVPYGLGLHLELALLGGAGIGNDQVLRLATAAGALALGLEQQIGTLEEGKLADFVVIDGDPLARLSDTLKIVAVAKDGVWHDRQALLTRP